MHLGIIFLNQSSLALLGFEMGTQSVRQIQQHHLSKGDRAAPHLPQRHWRRIKNAPQRLVLCRLAIDMMRTLHGTYAPPGERFGTRLETIFIGICVAIGDTEGRPFSVAKIATYMRVPRTTVIRRLDQLRRWGVIDRQGRHYYLNEKTLNSLIGLRSYEQVRGLLSEATKQLSVLDRQE